MSLCTCHYDHFFIQQRHGSGKSNESKEAYVAESRGENQMRQWVCCIIAVCAQLILLFLSLKREDGSSIISVYPVVAPDL